MGAWIEIIAPVRTSKPIESHPTWVRGLKFVGLSDEDVMRFVAPHVGAWIEIPLSVRLFGQLRVAPHVGAWIEIEKANFNHF